MKKKYTNYINLVAAIVTIISGLYAIFASTDWGVVDKSIQVNARDISSEEKRKQNYTFKIDSDLKESALEDNDRIVKTRNKKKSIETSEVIDEELKSGVQVRLSSDKTTWKEIVISSYSIIEKNTPKAINKARLIAILRAKANISRFLNESVTSKQIYSQKNDIDNVDVEITSTTKALLKGITFKSTVDKKRKSVIVTGRLQNIKLN